MQVNVSLKKPGSKLEHQGIKIEFIGQIDLFYDRGNHHEFSSLVKDLARPGELMQNTVYSFEFLNVEKPFESYTGSNVRLRYVVWKSPFFSFDLGRGIHLSSGLVLFPSQVLFKSNCDSKDF